MVDLEYVYSLFFSVQPKILSHLKKLDLASRAQHISMCTWVLTKHYTEYTFLMIESKYN